MAYQIAPDTTWTEFTVPATFPAADLTAPIRERPKTGAIGDGAARARCQSQVTAGQGRRCEHHWHGSMDGTSAPASGLAIAPVFGHSHFVLRHHGFTFALLRGPLRAPTHSARGRVSLLPSRLDQTCFSLRHRTMKRTTHLLPTLQTFVFRLKRCRRLPSIRLLAEVSSVRRDEMRSLSHLLGAQLIKRLRRTAPVPVPRSPAACARWAFAPCVVGAPCSM